MESTTDMGNAANMQSAVSIKSTTKKNKNIIIKRDYIGTQDMKNTFAEILKHILLKLPAIPTPAPPWEHEYNYDPWYCGQPPEDGEIFVTIAA